MTQGATDWRDKSRSIATGAVTRPPWTAIVWASALLSFIVQARFNLSTKLDYLASTQRVVDDTFYYLLPAWNFANSGKFTADGENLTYGFQPLWEILLVPLAAVSSDRDFFLRLTLLTSIALYVGTGILLYRLSMRWASGWKMLVAPLIWLFNPPLIQIFTVGKENALYAFLLVWFLIVFYRLTKDGSNQRDLLVLGVLGGALTLTRVNAVVTIVIALVVLLWLWRGEADKLKRAGLVVAAAVIVALPWSLYAEITFGTAFPNSGSRKLIGAPAALTVFVDRSVPLLSGDMFEGLLPESERRLLERPEQFVPLSEYYTWDQFVVPSLDPVIDYVKQVREWSTGYFTSWMPSAAFAFLALIIGALAVYTIANEKLYTRSNLIRSAKDHSALLVLGLSAVVNVTATALLLPSFLFWANWYSTPELIFAVIAISVAVAIAFKSLPSQAHISKLSPNLRMATGAAAIALVTLVSLALIVRFIGDSEPKGREDLGEPSLVALEMIEWANENLPDGARVGSWDSGTIGWLVEDATVINLDGLANGPDYVEDVYRNWFEFRLDLTDENRSWEYIKEQRIEYIMQGDYEPFIESGPYFYGVVPYGNYEVIAEARKPWQVGTPEGDLRFVIVKLNY